MEAEERVKTLYTSNYRPDGTKALDVLAFLLVKPEAMDVGEATLKAAQRQALLDWYAHAFGGGK